MKFKNCEQLITVKQASDRMLWLKTRNKGIGGSDAGVIMGLNKYKSPYELWMEKTGQILPPDLSNNQYVYWGTVNEANIAKWFEEETGKKVRCMGTLRRKDLPFMQANVDRVIVGENAGLEIKTAGVSQAKYWRDDEIPDSYYCQCLHYMAVTGADAWYIAVLIGGNEAKWKKIERNEDDINALIEAESKFWHLVEAKIAPPIDGSLSCANALNGQYSANPGSEIDLPDEAEKIIDDIELDELTVQKLKERIQEGKNRIMEMMQDNETGYVGDHKITWKMGKLSERVSLTKIKKSAPDIYQELEKRKLITITKSNRRFSIR